jgi:hypothetical protein
MQLQYDMNYAFTIGKICFLSFMIHSLSACNSEPKNENGNTSDTTTVVKDRSTSGTEKQIDTSLPALTKIILTALQQKDYDRFVSFFHPNGVRFSPYAHIDTNRDVRLHAKDFLLHTNKKDKMFWGYYDGSGDSILLNMHDYIKRFVYNADYLHAEKTAVNSFIGNGNSLNNLKEVYRNTEFSESYFSGFDKKYQGMDWTSLRLVFQKHQGRYCLIGMVHDQWTG